MKKLFIIAAVLSFFAVTGASAAAKTVHHGHGHHPHHHGK